MKNLLEGLNAASRQIHENNKEKGFYEDPRETGTLLMLVVSELSEALEADRHNRHARRIDFELFYEKNTSEDQKKRGFELYIKDSQEDEIADAIIRLLDYAGYKGIDLEWHIEQKLNYNKTRPYKHGKAY